MTLQSTAAFPYIALTASEIRAIDSTTARIAVGAVTTLKELVGNTLWAIRDYDARRILGRVFKDLVIRGDFPDLSYIDIVNGSARYRKGASPGQVGI